MEAMQVVFLLAALAAAVIAVLGLVRWRRASRIMGTRVLIGEAMKRRGISPADAEAAGFEAEVLMAGHRCATCASDRACRAVLSELGSADVPGNCPNRDFFDKVAQHKAVVSSATTGASVAPRNPASV